MNIKKPEDVLNLLEELKKELDDDNFRPSTSELPAKEMIRMHRVRNRVFDAIILIKHELKR